MNDYFTSKKIVLNRPNGYDPRGLVLYMLYVYVYTYKTNKKVLYTHPSYLVVPVYICVCVYIIYINTTSFYTRMCFADQAMAGKVPVVFSFSPFFSANRPSSIIADR